MNKGNTIDGILYDPETLNAKEHRDKVMEELSSISDIDKPRKKKRKNKGVRSNSSSSFNSDASRINFWRKYNQKIDPLTFNEFDELDQFSLDKRRTFRPGREEPKTKKQQRMIGDEEFRLKMDKLKNVFEIQKTKNKNTILDEAEQMFREKCKGVCKAFKDETYELLQRYHRLR